MIGRLHVITDEVLQDRFDHITLGRLALEGGANVVQYRDKRDVPDAERLRVASALSLMCTDYGATLIINDRPDLAGILGVGVHLGPGDMPVGMARRRMPGRVGATANNLAMALAVAEERPDYLGCGPVFGTTSKGASPPPTLGLDGLRAICEALSHPVIAIGSITLERVPSVLEAGAHGIAVLGAVCLADDPALATARLRSALDAALS